MVVLGVLPIPAYFVDHLDILRHVGVQVVLDDFLNAVISIEFEEEHEVNVVSTSTIQDSDVLNADDGGHALITTDTQHTKDFLAELDTCHDVIQN